MKTNLFGKTLDEIQQIIEQNKLPRFTAKQITGWLYKKRCSHINEMTNLSLKVRELLDEQYTILRTAPVFEQISTDETKKYLFSIGENLFVESVFIPEKERATLCISSQVGCKMNCLFCMTGKQGFKQNLTAGEILNQIQSLPEFDRLTNLVYMGMGEPFDNTGEVLKSLQILTSEWGYEWSPRRITVSTIGIIPGMKRFIEESQCHLAISLHSPFSDDRETLMPLQKKYPLREIISTLKQYNWSGQRRLSFEYIMFEGVNDSIDDCRELLRLLKGSDCRLNLIRFHAIPNVDLKGTDYDRMVVFRDILTKGGITTTIRASRGEDIMAACGMLSGIKTS